MQLDPSLKNYAVIGDPILHSKSPDIHQLFAAQFGLLIGYQKCRVQDSEFAHWVKAFIAQGGKGLNVTVPLKRLAYDLCDHTTDEAKFAESVNTISICPDSGALYGDTTDGQGLVNDLCHNHKISLKNKSILILGAGGAVGAISKPLADAQAKRILIANRTIKKATRLAMKFSGNQIHGCGYEDLIHESFDLIINGTSLSISKTLPPLKAALIHEHTICYDLMYANKPTVFMDWCQKNGAKMIVSGIGMLIEQAALSFEIWHNVRPDTKPVLSKLGAS